MEISCAGRAKKPPKNNIIIHKFTPIFDHIIFKFILLFEFEHKLSLSLSLSVCVDMFLNFIRC